MRCVRAKSRRRIRCRSASASRPRSPTNPPYSPLGRSVSCGRCAGWPFRRSRSQRRWLLWAMSRADAAADRLRAGPAGGGPPPPRRQQPVRRTFATTRGVYRRQCARVDAYLVAHRELASGVAFRARRRTCDGRRRRPRALMHRAVWSPRGRRSCAVLLRCCWRAGVTCFESLAPGTRAGTGAGPERSALQWIQAIQRAAIRVNYSGTIVYQAGGEMRTSRITHLFDGTSSHERVQTLDGKPREFIRLRTENNDEVRCLIPEARAASSSSIGRSTIRFPADRRAGRSDPRALRLKVRRLERVAGIECQRREARTARCASLWLSPVRR